MAKLLDQIRVEMARQKLTPYALAKRAGMPAATITRILAGVRAKPGAETLERMVAALGVEIVLRRPRKDGDR